MQASECGPGLWLLRDKRTGEVGMVERLEKPDKDGDQWIDAQGIPCDDSWVEIYHDQATKLPPLAELVKILARAEQIEPNLHGLRAILDVLLEKLPEGEPVNWHDIDRHVLKDCREALGAPND